jgi:phosphoglycolate phosphatase-like HAD superfamily hydrolase
MAIDFSQVKAVCFDVDGTLIDTDDQFVKNLVRYFKPLMIGIHEQDVLPMARKLVMFTEGPGNWLYSIADKLGLDGNIVALGDRLYEMGIGETAAPYCLIDGVWQMLAMLRNRYPLSIISNRGRKSTLRFLFQFELVSFFTAVATGQTCRHTKPYPDQIFWAAEKMGVTASSCLMIGDTVFDIVAGKKAGAQTIGVLCGFGDENELRGAGADDILKTTADLIDLISKNN